jgi:NAD(P)-dependent dehydrogenase (short-subunit alcohol dehydrogenase family)
MQILENKVALITGSSRGIGNAIARICALAGADIVINYRKAGGTSLAQAEKLCEDGAPGYHDSSGYRREGISKKTVW